VITSGTLITTDPSITTNGITDYGKIYRGRSNDGPISAWAFGSTSAFDTASGFDALIGDSSGAVFKFAALQLTGDPIIDTTSGEINLGLIAVNGITSGGPGGVLTFEGIRGLLLATQNGPITLGPEISFSGLHDLTIYARGSGSDLSLGSDINTTSQVSLFAERDMLLTSSITTDNLYAFVGRNISITDEAAIHAPTINLFAGQNLNWSGQISDETAFNSNGNVSIWANQMINVANDLTIIRRNGGITSGLNILLYAGTWLVGGDLSIATDISNLTTGANIVLAGGNLTVGGSVALQTSATAQSGTGGNIDLSVGGTLTAADLFLGVEMAVQAPQESGENVTLFVGNNLITHNESNSGGIDLEIITPVQQTVNSGANLVLSVGNNLTTDAGGDTTLFINNNINEVVNGARIFAEIGGNLTTNNLTLELLNNGGEIGTGGIVTLTVSGDITTHGAAIFDIQNTAGTMDQGALIGVTAGNISANSLSAQIDNSEGGVIGGAGGVIAMNVAGNANIDNNATLAIYGSDGAANSEILVNGGNYNVGGTFLNYIDGNGAITFNNASAHADILKAGVFGANGVLNIGGGTLSADETLKLYAPGSNGQLNFISNVTLGGNSKKILAANSITIFDNVVVTIGGELAADVFTNNANYSEEWGGNGSTTGTFAGAGAKRPRPLSEAPPFGISSPGNPTHGKRMKNVINVRNSEQLLALLDGGVPGPDGRTRFPHHRHRHELNRDRLNVNRMIKADRDMADIRRMRDRGVINNRLGSGARAF
jgi:hypothetical protein